MAKRGETWPTIHFPGATMPQRIQWQPAHGLWHPQNQPNGFAAPYLPWFEMFDAPPMTKFDQIRGCLATRHRNRHQEQLAVEMRRVCNS